MPSTASSRVLPECEALVVRQQQVRWTYRELHARVDAFAAGLVALGIERGDRLGIWSPNNAEWVVAQFATARGRAHPRQHQPRLPACTSCEFALAQSAARRSSRRRAFKGGDYLGDAARDRAGDRSRDAGRAPGRRACRSCGPSSRSAAARASGVLAFDDVPGLATARSIERLRALRQPAPVRRSDQHPVHERHDRARPKARRSRTTTSSTTATSSARRCG